MNHNQKSKSLEPVIGFVHFHTRITVQGKCNLDSAHLAVETILIQFCIKKKKDNMIENQMDRTERQFEIGL